MNRRDELIVQWSRESFNKGKQAGDSKSDSEADEVTKNNIMKHVRSRGKNDCVVFSCTGLVCSTSLEERKIFNASKGQTAREALRKRSERFPLTSKAAPDATNGEALRSRRALAWTLLDGLLVTSTARPARADATRDRHRQCGGSGQTDRFTCSAAIRPWTVDRTQTVDLPPLSLLLL
ncbi:hypothetical protein EVAR_14990_1 [Eumeta japonica]|uniref:Uncharacterized protein n=1 Tax=Eumeta variegata TaxID=151549 RepID=A0A4C1X9F3_EUMVA|nr:hypothetical protein EVAR_14990_1 [Eumeta japonica]